MRGCVNVFHKTVARSRQGQSCRCKACGFCDAETFILRHCQGIDGSTEAIDQDTLQERPNLRLKAQLNWNQRLLRWWKML